MSEIKFDKNKIDFYKVDGEYIEGFLGDNNKADILFILREPNTNKKITKEFWFKNVVEGKNPDYEEWISQSRNSKDVKNNIKRDKIARKKYLNVYEKLALKLLDNKDNINSVLKKCAYMNLYPFSGEGKASDNYKNALKAFKGNIESSEKICINNIKYRELISNRKSIIEKLISEHDCKYIVTTYDIFDAFMNRYNIDNKKIKTIKTEKKDFRYFDYKNTRIFEFYHPAASFSYNILDSFKSNKQHKNTELI